MNVYLFIDRRKKSVDVHGEYAQLLREGCEAADTLAEADVVHLLGAWSFKAARIARRARRMGIPYMVTPLGAVSPWNRTHPTGGVCCKRGSTRSGCSPGPTR